MSLKLYSYYRSSSAYRVRIALALLELDYEYIPVHLLNNGGEQNSSDHLMLNPMAQVPVLVAADLTLSQSLPIIQYLSSLSKESVLFGNSPVEAAQICEICEIINSGIQPLQNLTVLNELTDRFKADPAAKASWAKLWIHRGFTALETLLSKKSQAFCVGNQPTAADTFLIPQIYNAHRFEIDMDRYPTLQKINAMCIKVDAFQKAHPENQPDNPGK